MRLLLDTHALLWWFIGHRSLSMTARSAIGDETNDVFVSAVSGMESATKHRLGKLLAVRLALAHKDPFDRLLIAQALLDNLVLVSNEAIFDAAGVSRLW